MSLLERVYFLHQQLTENRYPNSRTLMEEFEISLPTARRDFAYLRDRLLAPLEFDQKKNGFFYTEDEFNLPFENSPRIIFLLGVLNKLAEEAGLADLPEIKQLEKRLSNMVGQGSAHFTDSVQCEWVEVEYPNPQTFDTIINALVRKRQLAISYRSPAKEITKRTVEPLKLINYQGRWYLSAWCLLRDGYRTFHLARISSASVKQPLKSNRRIDYLIDHAFGIFKGKILYHATIKFTGLSAEIVKNQQWHKDQKIEYFDDYVILRVPINDYREIQMKILQHGSNAKVLGPESLAVQVKNQALSILKNYENH